MATGLPTYKVILCGEYGAGKSAIFRRFIDNSFTTEIGQKSTIGLDYFSKPYTMMGSEIKLELWDTAGIERFATLSSSYFHGASAAILCYSSVDKNSFNMLSQHMLEIIMHSKTAKIFLCGTKVDIASDECISEADLNQFQIQCDSAISEIFQISSKSGEGVQEMFKDIAKVLVEDSRQRYSLPLNSDGNPSFMIQKKTTGQCC